MTDIKHQMSILGNAIDSLNEAMHYYVQYPGNDGNRSLKFAVLLITHFAELYFKHCITLESNLLIYKNNHKQIKEGSTTISLYDSIGILENIYSIDKTLKDTILFITKIRNQIQHFKFSYHTDEVAINIGRILYRINEFNIENDIDIELINIIDSKYKKEIESLCDGYRMSLEQALKKIEYERQLNEAKPGEVYEIFNVFLCHHCDERAVIKNSNQQYECVYCGKIDNYLYECDGCGDSIENSEDYEYSHPYCSYCYYLNHKHEKE
jgi:hypothetical protein